MVCTRPRLFGKPTATYESASTRRFQLGRVDCIRSATCEAWEWAAAMLQQKQGASPVAPPSGDHNGHTGDERKVTFVLYDVSARPASRSKRRQLVYSTCLNSTSISKGFARQL